MMATVKRWMSAHYRPKKKSEQGHGQDGETNEIAEWEQGEPLE